MHKNLSGKIVPHIILCSFCFYFITACSTVEGVGKDLKKAGEAISDASKKESAKKSR